MTRHLLIALRMALVTIVVLGLVYPLVLTAVAQLAFSGAARGSLVTNASGDVLGSRLIGQSFSAEKYFHPRPSAGGYDGLASGGSNLGPTSKELETLVTERVRKVKAAGGGASTSVPIDMVTASGSGLDPDISVANALAQVPRVARARAMTEATLRDLVLEHVAPRQLGFLGEQRVNVLELDLALDALKR